MTTDFRVEMAKVGNFSLNLEDTTDNSNVSKFEDLNDQTATNSLEVNPYRVAKICANVVAGILITGFFVLIGLASYGTIPLFALLIGGAVVYVGAFPAVALFAREKIFRANYGEFQPVHSMTIPYVEDEDSYGECSRGKDFKLENDPTLLHQRINLL
jgi:hypothetical protein